MIKKRLASYFAIIIIFAIILLFITYFLGPKLLYLPSGKIRVGYIKHAAELPLYVALENGYFEKQNLKVELIPLGYKEEMDALIRGDIDIIPATSLTLPFGVESESPELLKLHTFGGVIDDDKEIVEAIVVLNESSIYSLNDLKNKKIGVTSGGVDLFVVKTVLTKVGLKPEENNIQILQMDRKLLLMSLASRQVDAIYVTQPDLASIVHTVNSRYVVINPRAKYILNPFWSGAGVVTSKYLIKNSETFKKYLVAIDEAIEYSRLNPIESKKLLVKYTPVNESIALDVGIYFKVKSNESINLTAVQQIADTYVEVGILKKNINVTNLYLSPEYVKAL
ncbi:MAG: ABC transporter substrate-binding protein [Candidatus Aenigmatarchaeota archaeon]